ncbi:hypothetical protein XcodCFBP4690_08385 [Xanthomonas codiaei]|uniref:Uncharacterized protein n=1 Tax=Xanthomonas codiaei TaxID=56463 RepID=A0A2S7CSP2_9XANT|nr:hypothetical protein XcodCFBP4690_08385 [Xanthomonas codiaei]
MPPPVPQSVRTPHQTVGWWFLNALRTDQLDWSLPAHRRGPFGGMNAAKELAWTYLQRVLRW